MTIGYSAPAGRATRIRHEGGVRPAAARLFLALLMGVSLLALGGCDIQNPTSVTVATADPALLIRGVRSKFSDAMGIAGHAFVASDEGMAKGGFQSEDQTGDISAAPAYRTWYSQMHQARILSDYAIQRAKELGQSELEALAHVWKGWVLTRLAELWGSQPFDGGAVVPEAEILSRALAEVQLGTTATVDSTRHRAYAGIARINWATGRNPVDRTRLEAAIAAAQTVLSENPAFRWVEMPNFNSMNFPMGRSYGPTPFYRDIPLWFPGHPTIAGHDNTLIYNDQTKPQGIVMIDADELRLIQAESHLLLGNLAAAKAAVKSVALLKTNHVRLGRQPNDPALTQAQVDAYIDPMTAAELAVVIDGLQRENQYLSARRPIKEDGAPIHPFKLPPNA